MKFPQASTLPRWRQKVQYILNPLEYLDGGLQQSLDVVNAPIIGKQETLLLMSHPQGLKQLFNSDTKQFFAPRNDLVRPVVGDRSMFSLEEARHLRKRKLLLPPFHGDRIHQYGQLICQLTEQIMDRLGVETRFIARDLMQSISLEVIIQAVFGLRSGSRFEALKPLITRLMNLFKSPLTSGALYFPILQRSWGGLSPWHQFLQLKQRILDLIIAEIHDRRSQDAIEGDDILSLLLAAIDENGQPMSDLELQDQLITLLFAGQETTATAMAWALYWIHRNAEVKEKLRRELATVQETTDLMTVFKLPYLSAVCSETLRIYPITLLTFPREVREPVTLLGYELQPGMRIYGSIYGLHRREDLYPHPREFRPERFLERNFTPYEFMPFGGGCRRCIGEALAWWEIKLAIATIMRKYELRLASDRPEIPKKRGVTLAPDRGVEMVMLGKRPY